MLIYIFPKYLNCQLVFFFFNFLANISKFHKKEEETKQGPETNPAITGQQKENHSREKREEKRKETPIPMLRLRPLMDQENQREGQIGLLTAVVPT